MGCWSKRIVSLLLITLFIVTSLAQDALEETTEVLPPVEGGYFGMYDFNFTLSIFEVPFATAGGQKDLKTLEKALLRSLNAIQRKSQKSILRSQGLRRSSSDFTDLLVYDMDVIDQYVSFAPFSKKKDIWFNSMSIRLYIVCMEQFCPAYAKKIPSASQLQRKLQQQSSTGQNLVFKDAASDVKWRLRESDQKYFSNVKCLRFSTSTTMVDVSGGCSKYPQITVRGGVA
jgi:hypothetical protein